MAHYNQHSQSREGSGCIAMAADSRAGGAAEVARAREEWARVEVGDPVARVVRVAAGIGTLL